MMPTATTRHVLFTNTAAAVWSLLRLGRQGQRRIRRDMQTVVDLFRLTKDGQLGWMVYFVQQRARYRLGTLHAGITMNRCGQGDSYNFRRNIHRLEKGLSRKQLKEVFAEAFIGETVKGWLALRQAGDGDPNALAWGEAILDRYFQSCPHRGRIEEAYRQYRNAGPRNHQPTWCPYEEGHRPAAGVPYASLYQLACRRRSIRHYLDKPVDFEVIRQAMRVAALSPSACNRQPFQFLFYNDRSLVRQIARMPGGVEGYELPSIAVVIGRYRAYFDERDETLPFIDASLATMAFLFALETLGLSSVCINWPSLPDRDRRLREVIHLEDDETVILLIGIGYPDPEGKIPFSAKKEVDELVTCNDRIRASREAERE